MQQPIVRLQQHGYNLENGIREAILQSGEAKGLVVLEGLYYLKYDFGSWLTFDQIYRQLRDNFGCSYRLVYEGLQARMLFQRRKASANAHQRGARPYLYRVPRPAELRAHFTPDGQPTPSDPLQKSDLKNVTSYRMALHRELYIRKWSDNGGKGFKMYRGLQADRLGVSTRTIRTYDKKLGFSYEANFVEKRIYWKDWDKLPRYKDAFDAQGKKLPSRKWLRIVDWNHDGFEKIVPYVAYMAYEGLRNDCAVYEVSREANTYYPYLRPDPKQYEGGVWNVDFYMEEKAALEAAGFYREDHRWVYQRE